MQRATLASRVDGWPSGANKMRQTPIFEIILKRGLIL